MTTVSRPILAMMKSMSGQNDDANRDVIVTPNDVTRDRHNRGSNADDCEQRHQADDATIADNGVMIISADQHSTGAPIDELRCQRSWSKADDASGSEESSMVRCETISFSRADDFVANTPNSFGAYTTTTRERRSNIPLVNNDELITCHLQPVRPLVSTDVTRCDYNAYGSNNDVSTLSTCDAASDSASEVSDDVASVIEMPITSSGDDMSDVGDVTLISADENESGIYPDYDPISDAAIRTPPLMSPPSSDDQLAVNRCRFARSTSMFDDESVQDRQPTPSTLPGDELSYAAPTRSTSVLHFACFEGRPLSTPCASRNIEEMGSDTVPIIRFNETSHATNTSERRDFSQTAPWRVVPGKHRSSMSLLSAAAVGASFSDPDIASSSATAERIATTSARIANRRACAELELTRRGARRAEAGHQVDTETSPLSTNNPPASTVIHLPITLTPNSSTMTASSVRLTATVAIISSSANRMPSRVDSDERKPLAKTETVTISVVTNTASPRCYIPQKPPPLPCPGSAGPDLRSSLKSVALRATTTPTTAVSTTMTTSSSPVKTTAALDQTAQLVATKRWNEQSVVVDEDVDDRANMPQRPVREMVAELNSRLERCERSTSESVDSGSPLDSPFGSRYDLREAEAARMGRLSSSGSESEKEIFINSPPVSSPPNNAADDEASQSALRVRQFLSGDPRSGILNSDRSPTTARRPPIIPTVAYHGTIVYSSPPPLPAGGLQPSPRGARRFSLPVGSALSPSSYPTVSSPSSVPGGSVIHQRKVRFAEPLESSVIEIESSRRRHRTGAVPDAAASTVNSKTRQKNWLQPSLAEDAACAKPEANSWLANSPDTEYGSVTSLSEKLDRIELEHALASAAMRRSRPFQQQQQPPQQHQQQLHGYPSNEEVPWNHTDSMPTVLVSPPPNPTAHSDSASGSSRQRSRTVPGSPKLEPIRERVIAIQPASSMPSSPERFSTTYYGGDATERPGGSAPSSPLIGGLRYLFRRRSNADVTRLMSPPNDGGGFSVSIAQAAPDEGGSRHPLLVQQSSPGVRVNLVFPSTPASSGGRPVGGGYAVPSSPVLANRSLPPSYEESVRASGSPAMMRHQRRRSPSLHDFNAMPFYPVNALPPHHQQHHQHHEHIRHQQHQNQQQQHQQHQLAASRTAPSPGHSPTTSAAYSQTLQVDTAQRQHPRIASPRLLSSACDVQSPMLLEAPGPYSGHRTPPHSASSGRQVKPSLDQVPCMRSHPGREHDVGVYPAGVSGRQSLFPSQLPTIAPERSWHRHMTSPEMDYHNSESPTMSIIPLNAQAMMTSQQDPTNNYTGILAFLDKTFTEKILNWQAQRLLGHDTSSDSQLHQSETYRMVQEMDKQQQYRGTDQH